MVLMTVSLPTVEGGTRTRTRSPSTVVESVAPGFAEQIGCFSGPCSGNVATHRAREDGAHVPSEESRRPWKRLPAPEDRRWCTSVFPSWKAHRRYAQERSGEKPPLLLRTSSPGIILRNELRSKIGRA